MGLALLVVLEMLAPDERLAFVLHDMFAMPFDEIAPIIGRSPAAARQMASRARRRVQGAGPVPRPASPASARSWRRSWPPRGSGDLQGLLAVLHPDVVRRVDPVALPPGAPTELRGAQAVARGALAGAQRARATPLALAVVDGHVGVVVAPRGRLSTVITFKVRGGRILEMDVITDPARLGRLDLAGLGD